MSRFIKLLVLTLTAVALASLLSTTNMTNGRGELSLRGDPPLPASPASPPPATANLSAPPVARPPPVPVGARRVAQGVSIVVITMWADFAGGRLAACLRSFGAQEVLPSELVVSISAVEGGDCSSVEAMVRGELPAEVATKVNCSQQARNQAEARQIGANTSTGSIIIFNDGDDEAHPQRVEAITDLFRRVPGLQALGHTYASDVTLILPKYVRKDFDAFRYNSTMLVENVTGPAMRRAGRRRPDCSTGRCWIIRGLVPGAPAVRREVLHKVRFECPYTPPADNNQYRRGCSGEDSSYFRKVLEAFRGRDEVYYFDLPLIFYRPYLWWATARLHFNDTSKSGQRSLWSMFAGQQVARLNGAMPNGSSPRA